MTAVLVSGRAFINKTLIHHRADSAPSPPSDVAPPPPLAMSDRLATSARDAKAQRFGGANKKAVNNTIEYCYFVFVREENRIAREVVDAALKLHRHFGPGVYESVYEPVLVDKLKKRDLTTRQQTPVPLIYEGVTFDIGFKTDVVVNDLVILELKSVEKLEPVHFKQLLTYLRLTGLRLGLLINFGENLLKDGIHRIVNDL